MSSSHYFGLKNLHANLCHWMCVRLFDYEYRLTGILKVVVELGNLLKGSMNTFLCNF